MTILTERSDNSDEYLILSSAQGIFPPMIGQYVPPSSYHGLNHHGLKVLATETGERLDLLVVARRTPLCKKNLSSLGKRG